MASEKDRFDALPRTRGRVGAHRGPRTRGVGWLWFVVAVVVAIALVFGTLRVLATLMDREFPRAVLYCLTKCEDSLRTITGTAENTFSNPAEKHLGRLCADLSYAQVDEIIKTGLHEYVDSLQTRLNQIHDGIYKTFFEIHSEEASAAVGG